MKKSRMFLGALCAAVLAGGMISFAAQTESDSQPKPDKDGFVSLFNGKDLDGWKVGHNAESWSVKDGEIVVHGKGPSHLFYVGPIHDHDWKDFHLKAMVMTLPHANSGIYFHTAYQEENWPDQGFECQVNCTHSDWKKTGSLYDIVNIRDPHHQDNKWFLYDIIVKGNHVVLKIDGKTVCDWTQPADFKPPSNHPGRYIQHGTFALQGHDPGSECHFKDIKVKPLE